MPKPVKKAATKKKSTTPKRPSSDPNRRAKQLMDEHATKAAQWQPPWAKDFGEGGITLNFGPETEVSFAAQLSAHMKAIGAKGGKASGAKRMTSLTPEKRQEVALKAARARWAKRKD